MRAGELKSHAKLLELSADLCPVDMGGVWLGIKARDAGGVPMPSGLRSPALIDIRARYSDRLRQGRYLRYGDRLMQITSVRDPLGNKAEMRISADEFVGIPATYLPQERAPATCRTHLVHEAPYLDELGQVTDYRTRAEVALIEVGRPEVGDRLTVAGVTYNVIAYASESDDGVVRGLWLERQ